MRSITALLHTSNDAPRLGRALETLHPCDEILIVDHGSHDATLRIAHEYGARVVPISGHASTSHYVRFASYDWILCIEPRESLSEALAASLYEWKSAPGPDVAGAFNVFLRAETAQGWIDLPALQTRLTPKKWTQWQGWLSAYDPSSKVIEGQLLRFLLTAG